MLWKGLNTYEYTPQGFELHKISLQDVLSDIKMVTNVALK